MEAYHGGIIRTLLYLDRDTQTIHNVTVAHSVLRLALLRGKLGAGNGQGIVGSSSRQQVGDINQDTATSATTGTVMANVVAADPDGLAYFRVPSQASPTSRDSPLQPKGISHLMSMLLAAQQGCHAAPVKREVCWHTAVLNVVHNLPCHVDAIQRMNDIVGCSRASMCVIAPTAAHIR